MMMVVMIRSRSRFRDDCSRTGHYFFSSYKKEAIRAPVCVKVGVNEGIHSTSGSRAGPGFELATGGSVVVLTYHSRKSLGRLLPT